MVDIVEFTKYVKKAIKYTAITFYKSEKKEARFHALNIDEVLLSATDDSAFLCLEQNLDEYYFENEILGQAMTNLNKEQRKLLELKIIQGYADREIAKLTLTKEDTVTKRKARLYKKLKEKLKED